MSFHHRHLLLASLLFLCLLGAGAQCLPAHRDSLLQLKQRWFPNSTSAILASWARATDCCLWYGLTCDKASGEVTGLDLSGLAISGTVDPALFSLTSLRSLNLSLNQLDFSEVVASPGFETLTKLTSLNLSTSGFTGQIPIGISRLTNLVSLDFSNVYLSGPITLKNPNLRTLIQNLTQLEVLHLDSVSINSSGRKWCRALSESVPKLRVLSLSSCGLSGAIDGSLARLRYLNHLRLHRNNFSSELPDFFRNLTSLTSLKLSASHLRGRLPESIFGLRSLTSLDLSENPMLTGSLSESIGNLASLKSLKISNCMFSGPIPTSISMLAQMIHLDMSRNNLSGDVPRFQSSASSISSIILSHNRFGGSIPTSFEKLQNLVTLDLQNNSLIGSIPTTLFSLPKLQSLQLSQNQLFGVLDDTPNASLSLGTVDLSNNNLQGPIPTSIFKLFDLKVLTLANNNFSGTVDLSLLQNLANLTSLDLSNNLLTVVVKERYSFFPNISRLNLAFCNMTKIPVFLKKQTEINHLDLSGNKIPGIIPNWIWSIGGNTFNYLNLSYNFLTRFESPLPYLSSSSLSVVDLHSNKIQGPMLLPPPSNLVIDYSNNNLISSIPLNISLSFTIFFSVSKNNLSGPIPSSICSSLFLQVLDLSLNNLGGPIPQCFAQMKGLRVLNLGGNRFSGVISLSIGGISNLRTLNLNKNSLEGELPASLSNCTMLEVLDIGNNQITGSFPSWLGNLVNLRVLVLKSNKFYGTLQNISTLNDVFGMLQIIDLSSNNFTGSFSVKCFRNWKEMMRPDKDPRPIVQFNYLALTGLYYRDMVMVTSKGLEMTLVKILTVFTSIDISSNRFEGNIPEAIGDLTSLSVLNMSHNQFSGSIPGSIGGLKQLESLDLSWNNLSGEIPVKLTSLTFLSVLNLSYNFLVGQLPQSKQFLTFTSSSFKGNHGLCGSPLLKPCVYTNVSSASEAKQMAYEFGIKLNWEFIFIGLGFGGGLALVIGPLLLSSTWRTLFSDYVDKMLLAIIPYRFWYWVACGDGGVDAEEKMVEETLEKEEDMQTHPFCVICTNLGFSLGKVIICHTECSCTKKDQ